MLSRVQKQIVRRLVSPNTKQEGTSALLTKMNKNAIDQFFCHFSYCLSFEILFEIKSDAQNEIILWKFPYLSQMHNRASSTLVELLHTHKLAPTIREAFLFHFCGKLWLWIHLIFQLTSHSGVSGCLVRDNWWACKPDGFEHGRVHQVHVFLVVQPDDPLLNTLVWLCGVIHCEK